jgi:hypothetical protein
VALASDALNAAGTVNVAIVHWPATAAGHPVSVVLAVKEPSEAMSASEVSETVEVPIASSSEASATIEGLALVLQSKVTFVVPAVTPRIREPATVPVPADTEVAHGALAASGRTAADVAAPDAIVRLARTNAVAPNERASLVRRGRWSISRVVEFFISGSPHS